jgi:hypothetical protein
MIGIGREMWLGQKQCCRRGRQRLRGHQSFPKASLLSKPAVNQWTHVQRLTMDIKGAFLIYYLEQVIDWGGTVYSLSHTESHVISLAVLTSGER